MTNHAKKAGELFVNGYNCAQAVLCAFNDVTELSEREAILTASALGGGIARLREVCGAVSAMAIVLGFVYGSETPGDHDAKLALYAHVQEAAGLFKAQNNDTIICRELLGALNDGKLQPEKRTAEYYKARPCRLFVERAAQILDEYLTSHPKEEQA